MRLGQAIFLGIVAVLLTLAVPSLARNSNAAKTAETSASPSCQAYQQAADGTWTRLPCQELGSRPQPQSRSASKGTTEETR
jgi:type II secretory pathway pseudopilin PulG